MRIIFLGSMAMLLLTGRSFSQTDLRSFAGRPDLWPHEVLTKAAVPSAVKNATAIPAGAAMKVVGLEGPLIDLDYQGGLYALPVAQTDFLERATANAANHPAPPLARAKPQTAAELPVAPLVEGPSAPQSNALGAKLAPDLLVFDHTVNVDRLITGGGDAIAHGYILLQFGGGRRWATVLKDLGPAMQAAHAHGAEFGTVLVPLQGSSVQSAIILSRESKFDGPLVDPRKAQTVSDLWTRYGHEGTFALALVGPDGASVAHTVAKGKGIENFGGVMEALSRLPVPK